ncbi:MAG: TonB-dependent receptor [Acidobacteria bacterium]|nr:TonB-dependent receptor [Acidobacteriota bacterium]
MTSRRESAPRRAVGLVCLLVAAVVIFTAQPLLSQEVSAGITGRITDPSGAAIVNANVIAKDQARATVWPTKTNTEGIYAFPRIPAGTYELRVEAAGFKTFVRQDMALEVNQRGRLDVQMEVGAVTESVQVTGEAPLLQSETTVVGAVISPHTIINTPLITRNIIALTLLAPGVTTTNPAGFINGQRTTGGGRPYVNGNRKEANNFLLDGIDNNLMSDNLTSYQPNLDAVQEFKMITNNASAEFGNFQGGIINVIIKSGTNGYHGSVFEFFRNDKLNANNWGRNYLGNPRPPYRYNIFGGTVGGKVIKDRVFFFADYQATRIANPGAPSTITVIPAEYRRGDFSRLASEQNRTLYNPFTTDAAGNRQPFPGNQIPSSLLDPVARNLFGASDLYPLPLNSALRNNHLSASSSYTKADQGDFKLDAKLTTKDDFSGRYSNGRQDLPGVTTFPLFYNSFNTAPFQAGVLNWTRTVSPTLVNEARFGINSVTLNNGGQDKGLGDLAGKLGIAGSPGGLPSISFGGFANGVGSANVGTQQFFANTTFHYADNVTLIHGRHMMKTGLNILRQHMNIFYAGNNGRTGLIEYNGSFTQGPNANTASPSATGWGEADFFLGVPSRVARGLSTGTWGHRKTIWGFYFQDDWRASDNLTLNLGIRWEYHTPLVEVADRQANFDRVTGQIRLAGKDGNSRALYDPYKKDWQPRVGFAWTPGALHKKTVFRGAYTISSFMEGTGTNLRLPLNPPLNTEYEFFYPTPGAPTARSSDGMNVLRPQADPYRNLNLRVWDPKIRPANTQQWNFTIEHSLPSNNVLSVGYVGQHGTHLVVPMPYFQAQLLPNGQIVEPAIRSNPTLRTIAQISGTESNGNQRYDGLQVSLRRRWLSGLEYQLSYTFSKGMSDAIGYYGEGGQSANQSAYWQNLYDQKAEWGPTYFDAKHMFVSAFVWDLPVGKGKKMGGNWNRTVDSVLGGWQLGGILNFRSGFPLTIQAADRSGSRSRGARANVSGHGSDSHIVGVGSKWFDITPFSQPVTGTFGNVGIGTVRGPGLGRFDLSIQKYFAVTERYKLEVRGEAYNLTNTPTFNSPARNVTGATFGEISSAQGERSWQMALKMYF